MRKTIYVLSLLILVLGTWLVVLWLPSFTPQEDDRQETRYGLNEGLELVEQDNGKEGKRYVVEDADGNIIDVELDYTEGYAHQMLRYSREYGLL